MKHYDSRREHVITIKLYIKDRVAEKYMAWTYRYKDAREMLQKLKKRVRPTDEARKHELRTK
jgi:hypothetical protein